jgi:hypothetical protein
LARAKSVEEEPVEPPVKKPWKFSVGGVYSKIANGNTYYGILTKCRINNSSGATVGFISCAGLTEEMVTADGVNTGDWTHVRGGVEI